VSIYGFENEEFIFPAVHHATKFCLLTVAGPQRPQRAANFVFFARQVAHLTDEDRRFTLTPEDIALLSPNTRTCPIFRSSHDAELTKVIYRRVPVLVKEGPQVTNPWGLRFSQGLFNMATDSGLFRTRVQLEQDGWRLKGNVFHRDGDTCLPLYEAKMIHHFDHRFGTYEGQTEAQANQGKLPELTDERHADPCYVVQPRYWVPAPEVAEALAGRWDRDWFLGWRDICRATDERTVIASLIPRAAVGHTTPLIFLSSNSLALSDCLLANLTAFALDYCARQKVGGIHLTYNYLEQLPVLPPSAYRAPAPWAPGSTLDAWLRLRILELVYDAWELAPFAQDCNYDGPPFRWDPDRRFLLRCELDAAFFLLYGLAREDVAYVMNTFPIVRRDEERLHGTYRTRATILAVYDALHSAMTTGNTYQTSLDPPPASPLVCQPPSV
jgi:hypothetical protein